METFLRIDINFIATILLGSVFIISFKRLDHKDYLNSAFLKAIVIIILELIIESLTCILNKSPNLYLIPVSSVLHVALFTVSPLLTYYWFYLIMNLISNSSKLNKKFRQFCFYQY